MKVDDYIRNAKKDKRVRGLCRRIEEKLVMEYHLSDGDHWTSELMEGDKGRICYCHCKYPSAAFAHELLHLDTKLNGFRSVRIHACTQYGGEPLELLLECLDNELQHHKFYGTFVSLGFPPEAFYADDDIYSEDLLRYVVAQDYKHVIDIVPHFFSLIAPGGCIEPSAKEELRQAFLDKDDGRFKEQLINIEEICEEWRMSDSYDCAPFFRRILLVVQPKPHFAWFGYSLTDRPPQQGFFIDEEFEIEEVQR